MPAVAPSEFPPPFDAADVIGPPTDADGRSHRGRGRDRRRRPRRPRLREQADAAARERAGADREAGRSPGGGDREGQSRRSAPALRGEHEALGDGRAVPRPRQVGVAGLPGGHQGRGLRPHAEQGDAAEADAAELPQPRQLRHLGRQTGPLPLRQSRGSGRLHPLGDRRDQAAGRGPGRQGRALRRPRPRQGGRRARQLRARLRRRRQGDRARRGHRRPPHLRGLRLLRHARRRPDALGARGERGLGGEGAARPGDPHDGLAAAQVAALQRVRRQLHLPDGRGQDLHRPRRRPRLHRRDLQLPRRAAAAQDPPLHQEAARRRQAGRLGREDDPLRRLLRDAEAPRGPRHGDRRRRRQHGQHPDPEGRPLRDARRDVRGGDDRRRAERKTRSTSRPTTRRSTTR